MDLTKKDIKNRRLELGLTQKQAAELCNVTLRTYIAYENCEFKNNGKCYRNIVMGLQLVDPDLKYSKIEIFKKLDKIEKEVEYLKEILKMA